MRGWRTHPRRSPHGTTPPPVGRKFNPGHYVAIDIGEWPPAVGKDTGTFTDKDGNTAHYSASGMPGGHTGTAAYPGSPGGLVRNVDGPCSSGVRGVVMPYYWNDLEPTKGVYDFTRMDADLACCKALGVQLVAMLVERSFNISINPAPGVFGGATDTLRYLNQVPYAIQYTPSGGGHQVSRWNLAVVQVRFNLLVQAVGNRFDSDPNFEGVATQETSASEDNGPPFAGSEQDQTNYNSDDYLTGLTLEVDNIALALPTSRHFGYQNFIPQGQGDAAGHGRVNCDAYAAYLPTKKAVMGGPDILPDDGGLQGFIYPRYDLIHNGGSPTGPLFCSAQRNSYLQTGRTMQQLFDWCTGQGPAIGGRHIYLDYLFWTWIRGTAVNNFDPDARLVIASNPMTPFYTP